MRRTPRAPRIARRPLAALAAGLLLLPALAACAPEGDPEPASDVGVQLFQWTWDAIATECTDSLGPAGYGWVLTSPPQEHVLGQEWWTAYQPVSYELESRLGTREEFAAMVDTCGDAGVAVLADAVINHMTGSDDGGTGWAGSPFEHYDYPGLYTEDDFHRCGLTPGDEIVSYQDAAQVQTCELLNLADLDTGSPEVRAQITAYLEDLLSLGVEGFRIDAAKHMAAQDIAAIVEALPEGTRILQEVIEGRGEPIQPEDYLGSGSLYDFRVGRALIGAVGLGDLASVLDLGTADDALPSDQALVFVDNHDTERNGSTLWYRNGEDYVLANVVLLAGGYGTPVLYSGYAFTDRDAGPEQDADGAVLDASCPADAGPDADPAPGTWVCQHRWPAIAGMVGWRAAVGPDAEVREVWSQDGALALSRGESGFVVLNAGGAELTASVPTSMPDGTYCDVLDGPVDPDASGGACAGDTLTVDGGAVQVVLAAGSAAAIHVGAMQDEVAGDGPRES